MADQWLSAIENHDWDGMAGLLHTDAIYDDRSMTHFSGDAVHLEGRDAIVNFWRSSDVDSGTEYLRYDRLDCFEAGEVIVINAQLNVDVAGAFWNIDRELIRLNGPQTTILTIRDGLISRVDDYFDYATAMKQVDAHRERYGELAESQQASD
jgi:hypothetical protein